MRGLEFLFPSLHLPSSPFSPNSPATSRAAPERAGRRSWGCPAARRRRGAGRGPGRWAKLGPSVEAPRRQATPRPHTSGLGARAHPVAQPARPSGLGEGAAGWVGGAGRRARSAGLGARRGLRLPLRARLLTAGRDRGDRKEVALSGGLR